ncbi:NAD-dependent epimerase/dehydratase family protein [Paraflavitalea pollutisoli]|uniref:NAD-dependent epimerase/dehydratase family protein n=1 Tax=Paraflavitalea pollutisoli TaxID=3034143 RepID=UPI0023EADB35|nr:NAD-dependent epimerase/dehydratase family protein [Paraflavitalea sp. H1-2-19X]
MRILVLGSEGFIGKHVIRFYQHLGWNIWGADLFEAASADYPYVKLSRLSPELDDLLEQQSFDYCINAAGSGNVSYSVSHPLIDFEANALDVIRLLDAIRKLQPQCRYVQMSSAAVYGNPTVLPIREDAPCIPVSPYGHHKWIAEIICREYATIYKLGIVIVRPFSVYGPGLKKQLFWDLYRRYLDNPAVLDVWGTGQESRDFVFVEDLVAAIHTIILKDNFNCGVYNIASGHETTIAEAVSGLFGHVNSNTSIQFNNKTRAGDPLNWRADISQLLSLGYQPSFDFAAGIEKLAQWYKSLN